MNTTPVPSTAHIGGGSSARLIALGAVAILGAAIWAGASGKTSPSPTAPPTLAVAAPTTAPSTTSPRPPADPTPQPTVKLGEVIGAIATLGRRQYVAVLREVQPDHLYGTIGLPIPFDERMGTIELSRFGTDPDRQYVQLGEWPVRVGALSRGLRRPRMLVDIEIVGKPKLAGLPEWTKRGYRMTVRAETVEGQAMLFVDVVVGPRIQLVGGDGIFGWPTTNDLPSPSPSSPAPTR